MDRISSSKRRYCRIAFFRRDIAKRRKPAMHAIDPLYSVCGFVGGLLVGMTGVGGGSLMTPLLILLFGVHPATAVGTDLLFAAATKTGGSLVHRAAHLPQEAFDILCGACRRAFRTPDQPTDVSVGGGAGRAGVDLLGRRRRHRRHSSNPALSPPSHGEDRRLRHRPCGALDVSRRARTLDAGLGRLAHIRLAAG